MAPKAAPEGEVFSSFSPSPQMLIEITNSIQIAHLFWCSSLSDHNESQLSRAPKTSPLRHDSHNNSTCCCCLLSVCFPLFDSVEHPACVGAKIRSISLIWHGKVVKLYLNCEIWSNCFNVWCEQLTCAIETTSVACCCCLCGHSETRITMDDN